MRPKDALQANNACSYTHEFSNNETVDIGKPAVYLTVSKPDRAMLHYSTPFYT